MHVKSEITQPFPQAQDLATLASDQSQMTWQNRGDTIVF
jgi:hypothetical protein